MYRIPFVNVLHVSVRKSRCNLSLTYTHYQFLTVRSLILHWTGFPKNQHGHDALLNILDRSTKWAIVIPCTKTMNTQDLCDVLYKHVFSWVGLPESISGDGDTRLTASRMRSLRQALGLRVVNSTAYHPLTDGQTENFHRTLLSMMRAFVNKYHSN